MQQPGKETFIEHSAHFQDALKETGMFELWKIKEQIISSIGSQNLQINERNFLDANQVKIFFSKVLTAI
jgi:hypothetical protein